MFSRIALTIGLLGTLGWVPSSVAQVDCNKTLLPSFETLAQENDFSIDRSLEQVRLEMHPDFIRDLRKLGKEDILLEGGAGRANALIGYLYNPDVDDVPGEWEDAATLVRYHNRKRVRLPPFDQRAGVIAVGFKRPAPDDEVDHLRREDADRNPRFQYIEGDIGLLLENHPELEGKVGMIIDAFGCLKYSHFQQVLEVYLRLLKVGGKVYFNSPDLSIQRGDPGVDVSIVEYLHEIQGAQLKFDPGRYSTRYESEQRGTYVLTKTSSRTVVPALTFVSGAFDRSGTHGGETLYLWP